MAAAKIHIETKMIVALLELAAQKDWDAITIDQVAASAKVSFKRARHVYKTPGDLLPALVRYFDGKTDKNLGKIDKKALMRDRLFEVMMARFDALQNHRAGMRTILRASRTNPQISLNLFPPLMASMQHLLQKAGYAKNRPCSTLHRLGVLAIYQIALFHWENDTSQDMSATMAALDRCLRLAITFTAHYDDA